MSESCSVCGESLATRPVLKQVRGRNGQSFEKRVHSKPFQLVVSLRVEGSFGEHPMKVAEAATRLGAAPEGFGGEWRICGKCAGGDSTAAVVSRLVKAKLKEDR